MESNIMINCFFTLIASIGYAIIVNIRGINLIIAGLGGMTGWFLYLILQPVISEDSIRYFISAVVVSFYAETFAKIRKAPSIVFLVVSIIPLVPGYTLYKTMENLLMSDLSGFVEKGIYTFKVVMAISTGVLISTKVISPTMVYKRLRK